MRRNFLPRRTLGDRGCDGGSFTFELTNQGGGRYSDQRGFVFNPEVISVRSTLGGSATATLTS